MAVADLRGRFAGRRDGRNDARSEEDLVARVRDLARAAVTEAGLEWPSITYAMVGSPGVYDPEAGRL